MIPKTSEELPTLGLGTWQSFDVGFDDVKHASLKKVLIALANAGGGIIDSSPMYGSSEAVVGDLVKDLDIRDSVFLATKVWTTGSWEGIDQMNRSFTRMQTEQMDLLQVHNLVDIETHLKTL